MCASLNQNENPENQTTPRTVPWHALEAMLGFSTLIGDWQRLTGPDFPAFRSVCLQAAAKTAGLYPCPLDCGCDHRVLKRYDGSGAVAACQCNPPDCPDIPLTIEQITPLELAWPRLARTLADTFELSPRFEKLPPENTIQFGACGPRAIPVILTVQNFQESFRAAVAQLAALLRKPFILFAPTADMFGAICQTMLLGCGASFFPLDATTRLTTTNKLIPVRPPAELFAQFLPQPPPAAPPPRPRFMLKKECGVWHLIFDGQDAFLKHERGLFYVAWLLYHPGEVIHAIDLMAKIPEIYRHQLGLPTLLDPATGKTVTLQSHARLQERSLALDDAQSLRALYKKEKELEALLDSDDATEPEKAEALRELEQIADFQRQNASRSKDAAQSAVRSCRMSIRRVCQRLLHQNPKADSRAVSSAFALHLRDSILHSKSGPPSKSSSHVAGCLNYVPSPLGHPAAAPFWT